LIDGKPDSDILIVLLEESGDFSSIFGGRAELQCRSQVNTTNVMLDHSVP